MRGLIKHKVDKERGAAGVLVAVLMLALIGAGAMAVDVGQIYAERAQLQNAADAGAIAVVQACHGTGCTQEEAEDIAADLADGNSNDGSSTIFEVDMSIPNEVTVRTTTRDGTSGAGFLQQMFSSALDAPPVTVGAHATAGLFFPGAGSSFPLALSDCQFDLSEAEETGEVQLLTYKPAMDDCISSTGNSIPGGVGWLDQAECVAETDADDLASSNTGADYASMQEFCDPILEAWIAKIDGGDRALATFPVYDNAGKTGTKGWYHILGYATFDIQGWKFGGGHTEPQVFNNTADDVTDPANACTGKCLGIIGQFVKFESIDTFGGDDDGGEDLGTTNIRLIN